MLLHGRNPSKPTEAVRTLSVASRQGLVEQYTADLSNLHEVAALAKAIRDKHDHLDVLINNAGVYKTPTSVSGDGLDVRFVVNTIAPWLLTQRLLPLLDASDGLSICRQPRKHRLMRTLWPARFD